MAVPKYASLRLCVDNKCVEFKTTDPLSFFKHNLDEIWRLFYVKSGYTIDPPKKNRLNPRRRRALRSRTGVSTCTVKNFEKEKKKLIEKPLEEKLEEIEIVQADEQPLVALESSRRKNPVREFFSTLFKKEVVLSKSPDLKSDESAEISQREDLNFDDNTIRSIMKEFEKQRNDPDIRGGTFTSEAFQFYFMNNSINFNEKLFLAFKLELEEYKVSNYGEPVFYKDDVYVLARILRKEKIFRSL